MKQLASRTGTALFLVTIFCSFYFFLPSVFFSLLLSASALWIITQEWPQFTARYPILWLLAPLYPIAPFILLIMLNQHPVYHSLVLPLFLVVALFDTGSYVAGSWWGTHRIAPAISPGKSWEGALGGYLVATLGLITLVFIQKGIFELGSLLFISTISCCLALAGDLFESWLKRKAKIKDAGDLLAGHGGLLDRLDGILFTTLFFYYCADWLMLKLSY